jgi:hypothetical protein
VHASRSYVRLVAGHYRELVSDTGSRDQGVDGRQGASLILGLPEHISPDPRYAKVHIEDAVSEALHQCVLDPARDVTAPPGLWQLGHALEELSESDSAQVEGVLVLLGDPLDDQGVGTSLDQL